MNTLPFVSSGTFPGSQPQAPASPGLPARPPAPPPPRRPSPPRQGPVSSGRRECYFDTAAPDACDNILARNVTWQECCCTVGEGWGSGCRIQQCPGTETGGRGLREAAGSSSWCRCGDLEPGKGIRLDLGLGYWCCQDKSERAISHQVGISGREAEKWVLTDLGFSAW